MPRIIKNIDKRFNSIATASAAAAKKANGTDTLAVVLKAFGANFANVEPNEGIAYPVPAGIEPKNYLASMRGKLISVIREGQPWAGRTYKLSLDKAANEVVVGRKADGVPLPVKKGGRPKGSGKNAPAGVPGMDAARAHLGGATTTTIGGSASNGGEPGTPPAKSDDGPTPPANLAGAALAAWKKKNNPNGGQVKDLTAG